MSADTARLYMPHVHVHVQQYIWERVGMGKMYGDEVVGMGTVYFTVSFWKSSA